MDKSSKIFSFSPTRWPAINLNSWISQFLSNFLPSSHTTHNRYLQFHNTFLPLGFYGGVKCSSDTLFDLFNYNCMIPVCCVPLQKDSVISRQNFRNTPLSLIVICIQRKGYECNAIAKQLTTALSGYLISSCFTHLCTCAIQYDFEFYRRQRKSSNFYKWQQQTKQSKNALFRTRKLLKYGMVPHRGVVTGQTTQWWCSRGDSAFR